MRTSICLSRLIFHSRTKTIHIEKKEFSSSPFFVVLKTHLFGYFSFCVVVLLLFCFFFDDDKIERQGFIPDKRKSFLSF